METGKEECGWEWGWGKQPTVTVIVMPQKNKSCDWNKPYRPLHYSIRVAAFTLSLPGSSKESLKENYYISKDKQRKIIPPKISEAGLYARFTFYKVIEIHASAKYQMYCRQGLSESLKNIWNSSVKHLLQRVMAGNPHSAHVWRISFMKKWHW